MSQHKKLVCGGLFVFFAATHVGCAGSGIKNLFTRNETDGYQSLDELEAKLAAEADAADAESKEVKPSIAAKMASWRPFGTAKPGEEDPDAQLSKADETTATRSSVFDSLALSKRDSVAPDPFLGAEPKVASGSPKVSPSTDTKIAKTDKNRATSNEPTDVKSLVKPASQKVKDIPITQVRDEAESEEADAKALGAFRKPDSSATDSRASQSNDDDASLAKRFEQHFLLNSVGTVANAKTSGNDVPQESPADAPKAASKKRSVADLAERQIDQFEHLLADDPAPNRKASGFGRDSEAAPLKAVKRTVFSAEKSAESLFEFDQLVDSTNNHSVNNKTPQARKTAQSRDSKSTAWDVNVADAETLFGAAAARQSSLTPHGESGADAVDADFSYQETTRRNESSRPQKNSSDFEWNDPKPVNTASQMRDGSTEISGALGRFTESNAAVGRRRNSDKEFGAPSVSAGSLEGDDCSVIETADIRLSNASAYATDHQVVTANYGNAPQKIVVHPAAAETFVADDARFTAAAMAPVAPVMPVSGLNPSVDTASQATRPGFVQSFSMRNWLLLVGGIIVIALLFAPGRTKPLTMKN